MKPRNPRKSLVPTRSTSAEGNSSGWKKRNRGSLHQTGSQDSACLDIISAREPGDLQPALPGLAPGEPLREAAMHKPQMQELEKSDSNVVPKKSANKGNCGVDGGKDAGQRERVEDHPHRTPSRNKGGKSGLRRVDTKARLEAKKPEHEKEKFNNLLTHLKVELLREVYFRLKRKAAAGVDQVTWQEYGQNLEERLVDLEGRIHRGAYRPPPVRRTYIPKADGKLRPLGIPTIEDKIVQGAVVSILTPIYEAEFHDASYGFRPKRNQQMALDAVDQMIVRDKVNFVLDGDIQTFFDTIEHGWLIKMLEHRIGDPRLIRLINKWLKAGVLEDGTLREMDEGSPQGGAVSPLLANVYLHYVLDTWFEKRSKKLAGRAVLVRFADDFLIGLQYEGEAKKLRRELEERFRKFGLALHPEKTKVIRFGRFAEKDVKKDGQERPATFDFLGFTHICGRHWKTGKFQLQLRTSKKKRKAKLAELKKKLRERMHWKLRAQHEWLSRYLEGHRNYYGRPTNFRSLKSFKEAVRRAWHKVLQRRSQRAKMTRARHDQIDERFPLPKMWINKWNRSNQLTLAPLT